MVEDDFDLELQESGSDNPDLSARQKLAAWRGEVDLYHEKICAFDEVEPDEIFIILAGVTARASEIRKELTRMPRRDANAFRINEIDPLISECDRQFKLWSRLVAVRGIDARLAGAL